MNITDVDDKTIRASGGKQEKFKEITHEFEKAFFDDLEKLNIKKAETITRATEYVEKMVEFVSDLLDKGFAYKGEDGSIYYSIEKFKDYGKLSQQPREKTKRRIKNDKKMNEGDFVLWKFKKEGEPFWKAKIGNGRPGWHIEDTAITEKELGEQYDLHGGGQDLIFPHHEAEIAQMEGITGKKPFVKPSLPLPKPSEGELIEKLPEEPSIGLDHLLKPSSVISTPPSVQKLAVSSPSVPSKGAAESNQSVTPPTALRPKSESSFVKTHSYTCSDCARSFTAGVKLDPTRSLYCKECLEKNRTKRKERPVEKKQKINSPKLIAKPLIQKKEEPSQEKLGTLKTGETVHFD